MLEGAFVAAACDDTSLLPLTSVLANGQQHLMHCTQVLTVHCRCFHTCSMACSCAVINQLRHKCCCSKRHIVSMRLWKQNINGTCAAAESNAAGGAARLHVPGGHTEWGAGGEPRGTRRQWPLAAAVSATGCTCCHQAGTGAHLAWVSCMCAMTYGAVHHRF